MNTLPALDNLLHARTGPMTTELVQRPAAFGLGLGRVLALVLVHSLAILTPM